MSAPCRFLSARWPSGRRRSAPVTLMSRSLNNLAELYRVQGAYERALPLFERALAIREKALGPNHPDVATSLNNLAALHRDQGAYERRTTSSAASRSRSGRSR